MNTQTSTTSYVVAESDAARAAFDGGMIPPAGRAGMAMEADP